MVDTSNWGGLPDVKIDLGVADALAAGCEQAASTIRQQCTGRRSATTTAMQDFQGAFSRLFEANQTTANGDGGQIATELDNIAQAVRYIVSVVPAENKRRADARAWKKRHDEDKSHITFSDIGGDEPPPEGPTSPPPPKTVSASADPRDTPPPGAGGGGGGGTSSARPGSLRTFVSGVSGDIAALHGKPGSLTGLNDDFNARLDWGTGERAGVDGAGVFSAMRRYNELNQKDKVWVNTVATAFEQAGGSGGMATVSDAALAQSLAAAGVPATRADIPLASPRMYGFNPTTGYSDDPVNASTGNFVEPETDMTFAGGAADLALTRMYNSFGSGVGAFGPGWASWTEVRLAFDDEAALLTHPDGRVSQFPRLGEGWDRATGESLWLTRDEQADEMRVTDNDGGTWRFGRSGVPISHDRGEGTMVGFVRVEDRLVRLEHERGRHVDLVWDDDRVVSAEASDGRAVTYTYDGGRLVAVSGPLGTRRYRWNDAGLIEAVIDADGVVEVENTYDDQARVVDQRSPHGRVSRYTYLPGNVTEVADRDGTRANTWVHDRRGQLIGLIDSDGNRQSTVYDQHGNAVVITERDGSAVVREYDERGHVVREVLPSGADVQFAYDDLDRVVSAITEEGAETRFSYEGLDRQPSLLIDPEGGETRFEWSGGSLRRLVDPTGVELRFGHDEHGNLVSTTNSVGDTARLEYDASGRVVAALTPSGHRTTYAYGPAGLAERVDPDGAVWHYEHTTAGRLTGVVDPTGARSTIQYGRDGEEQRRIDPLGRATERRLDDLGNLASVELPDGSAWRFSFDALSRLTATTAPDGHTWTQSWDSTTGVVFSVDPLGRRTTVSTDEAEGAVVTADSLGSVTDRFDPFGRLTSAQHDDGSAAVVTYDRCGRAVEILDGEGSLTTVERDPAGRPVAVTDPTGRVTRFEFDVCGRRSAVVAPDGGRSTVEYDADNLPVRLTYPTGETGRADYDACGRPVSAVIPGVGTSRWGYDAAGRVVEVHDTASGLRRFTYDDAGQLVTATTGNGGVTRYDYDVLGRATTITDPLGGVTRREFDARNRCVAETDPLGRTTRAGYDAGGRQTWQVEPSGRRTEWTYDDADRIVEIAVDGSTVSSQTWDQRNRSVATTDHTRPDGQPVQHSRFWNRRGQIVRETRDEDTTCWAYDASGRRTSMTLPDGSAVTYGYDDGGRVATVVHPLLGRAAFDYDAAGRVVRAAASDLVQSWDYADGFMVRHVSTHGETSASTQVERDADGRIASIDRDGTATTFAYDAACQLIEAWVDDERVRWRYDAAGRVVTEARAEGNRELAYDAAGQLLSVDGPEGTTRHTYDGAGRRVRSERADGSSRSFEWSQTGWLASIVDESGGNVLRTLLHVDATGQLASLDGVAVRWDSAQTYAPSLVQVGATPVVVAGPVTGVGDQWGPAGWRTARSHDTDVWASGRSAVPAIPGMPDGVGISPAGELTVGGLEWLGARVYDASTHGFLSVDPLDAPAGAGWGANPYSYAGNDPLHALDPTGLKPVSEADLKEAAKGSWWYRNKDWVVGGVATVAGVALMATGVGGPAGAMLTSFGTDVLIQKATTGKVNYVQAGISGLAGGAGFVASKGLVVGGRLGMASKTLISAERVENMSTKAKYAVQGGIGVAQGYGSEVAGGADPLSLKAFGSGAAGGITGPLGVHTEEIGQGARTAVRNHILAGVEDRPFIDRQITRAGASVSGFAANHASQAGYSGAVGAGGEAIKQLTDGDGFDGRKVAGAGVGGSTTAEIPPGWGSPANSVVSAAVGG